jgi:SPP1 gp7 family putative phage head morphogenesis protein
MKRTILLSGVEAQRLLRRFLGAKEPGLIRAALRLWKTQAAMFDKDDAEAFAGGHSPEGLVFSWAKMNEEFVREKVIPELFNGFENADRAIAERIAKLKRKDAAILTKPAVQKWVDGFAADLIVEINQETRTVVNSILRTYAIEKPMSAFQISKMVESHVGLTSRYSRAVMKRYDDLVAMGISPEKAMKEMERYAQFLKRNRAMTIARNELSEAYGEGQFQAMREAVQSGAVGGQMKKSWATADDERTCPICQALDGETQDLEAPFSCGVMRPPAHIQCRCAVQYEVIANA